MEVLGITAEALKQQGNQAFASQQYKKAAKIYRDAIKLDGSNPVIFANRAQCFLKLADYTRALKDCESGLALGASRSLKVKLEYRKGLALKGLQQYLQASVCFQTVLSLDPSNSAAVTEMENLDVHVDDPAIRVRHPISVQVVDKVPVEFLQKCSASPDVTLTSTITDHAPPQALQPELEPYTESKTKPESPDLTPFGTRLSMNLLVALKTIPESQKHDAFKLVITIPDADLKALFGSETAGIEPEFLEFYMQAAAYVSSTNCLEGWVGVIYKTLELFQSFRRFELGLALCDHGLIQKLMANVALESLDYVKRYEKILS